MWNTCAGELHLLEQEFSALPLWCKASDGPHFDLNASVELLVPHVPYSLDWCGYCFVLQIVKTAASFNARHSNKTLINELCRSYMNSRPTSTKATYPASVQNGRCLENAAVHFRHLIPHHHSEFANIRVSVKVGTSHLNETNSSS